jgi:DNA polymerase-3 subunit epsilon
LIGLPRRRSLSPAARAYKGAARAPGDTPWPEAHFVVVDLETTGLDSKRDEIISFASIPIDQGRVVVGDARTVTVRPEEMPPPQTIRIHGLRPADLEKAPPLSEAMDLILEALTGRVLVAHVAWVERGFLRAALKTAGARLAEPIIDTAPLATAELGIGGKESPPALAEVARRLGLPVHRPHVAEGDALTTAQVFLALATHLDEREPQTVDSLSRLSG